MAKRKIAHPQAHDVRYHLYKRIALYFFITSIILFSLVFYFVFRRAIIHISPNYEITNVDFIADVKENPGKDEIAGRILQVSLEDSSKYAVESEMEEAKDSVVGDVKIINESNKAQALVATTRFLTAEGKLFRLKKYEIIPAGGKITAEVYADDPKTITDEIMPQRLSIPGLSNALQEKIYGLTEDSIKPNTGKIKVVKDIDIANAKEKITDELLKKAMIFFAKEMKSDEKILPKAIIGESSSIELDRKINEKADFINVKMRTLFTAVIFNEDDLFLLASNRLKDNTGKGRKVSGLTKDNLVYEVEKYDLKSNMANLKVMLAGKVSIDQDNVVLDGEKILGLTKQDAILILKNNPEIKDVKIDLVPSWLNRLPRIKNGIAFIIEE